MKMRWRLLSSDLAQHEQKYTATFVMLNVDTDEQVTVALTQSMNGPAIDLVGACRAVSSALQMAAGATETGAEFEKFN